MKKDKETEALVWVGAYTVAMATLLHAVTSTKGSCPADSAVRSLDERAIAIANRATETIFLKLKSIETPPESKP